MQRVSWRYNEPNSSVMSRQPAVSWASPVPCSTAGARAIGSTVERASIPSGWWRVGDVRMGCQFRMNKRFWLCRATGSTAAFPVCQHHLTGRCVGWLGTPQERFVLDRATQRREGRVAYRAHPPRRQRQRVRWQRCRHPQGTGLPRHVLHRPPQGSRQGLADRDSRRPPAPTPCSSEHAVRFLLDYLLTLYEAAGWPLQRLLTDRGKWWNATVPSMRPATILASDIRALSRAMPGPTVSSSASRARFFQHWRVETFSKIDSDRKLSPLEGESLRVLEFVFVPEWVALLEARQIARKRVRGRDYRCSSGSGLA